MKEPKNEKSEKKDEDLDPVLDSLAQAVIDNIQNEGPKDSEPFELYVHKVHSSVYSDAEDSCSRFVRGYHTLLKELDNQ